jgi:hypothetical protein
MRKDIADLAAVALTEISKFADFDPSVEEVPTLKAPYLGGAPPLRKRRSRFLAGLPFTN